MMNNFLLTMLMITTFPSRPSDQAIPNGTVLYLEWEGLNVILKHKNMGGVLVLTVLIISSLNSEMEVYKTGISRDSILLLCTYRPSW